MQPVAFVTLHAPMEPAVQSSEFRVYSSLTRQTDQDSPNKPLLGEQRACSAVTWFGRGHSAVAAPGADRWRLTDMPTDGCKKERPYPYNRPLVVGDTFLQDRVRLFSLAAAASLLLHL